TSGAASAEADLRFPDRPCISPRGVPGQLRTAVGSRAMVGSGSSDPAELVVELAAQGVVGVAGSYVDNSGIARVKAVPIGRLPEAAEHGIGMSPVFDVFMFDEAITSSPSSTGRGGDRRLFLDLER